MSHQRFRFGSANLIDFRQHQLEEPRRPLNFSDPSSISELLNVTEISDKAFPVITTGVRYWPWLLVARDFSNNYKQTKKAIRNLLPTIRRRVNRSGLFSYSRLGPTSVGTFAYYRSMYRKISELPESNPLRQFIEDRRRRFNGSQVAIFQNGEVDWRRAMRAKDGISRAAHQFAKELRRLERRDGKIDGPEEAITSILRTYRRFDEYLWKACFCYATFRCLYGIADPSDESEGAVRRKATKHDLHQEWARLLQKILESRPVSMNPEWQRLKRYIQERDAPFGKIYEKEEGRRILRSFRFYTFFYLYCRSIPRIAA